MSNITSTDVTEKRISLVYNSDITGFQPIDFSKIDGIEGLLSNIFVTGANIPSGITVYQANLDKDLDNVSVYISGDALNYLSGIVNSGVSLKGVNTVNINVTGNSIPVSGTVTANVDDASLFAALNFYATDGQDFPVRIASTSFDIPISGTVTASTEKSSNISNFTSSGSDGVVLAANLNRKELFVQNLATGVLYVKYGTNASSSSFNFLLAANTSENAGDGGSLSDQAYTGVVSVSGVITPNYISWERS
jgi:hypothetical protein